MAECDWRTPSNSLIFLQKLSLSASHSTEFYILLSRELQAFPSCALSFHKVCLTRSFGAGDYFWWSLMILLFIDIWLGIDDNLFEALSFQSNSVDGKGVLQHQIPGRAPNSRMGNGEDKVLCRASWWYIWGRVFHGSGQDCDGSLVGWEGACRSAKSLRTWSDVPWASSCGLWRGVSLSRYFFLCNLMLPSLHLMRERHIHMWSNIFGGWHKNVKDIAVLLS